MKKFVMILLCILSCGCSRDLYKLPKELTINENKNEYLVYSKLSTKDLISNKNIEYKDEVVNTNKIGNFKKTIEFTYNDKLYKYDVSYKIIDKDAPKFVSASSIITVVKNDDTYPCNDIVYIDNYDRKPSCEIEGDYDLTTTGSYNIKYVIKDSSNNIAKKDLKINVVDAISTEKVETKETKNILIEDVIKEHKTDNTMIGIDVSRWQEEIDFEKVKNAGVEFVIMRMGINSDTDKDISMDTYFKENIKKAKDAGLKVGVYIYTSAINKELATEHANWFLNNIGNEKLDFKVAYDWENWSKLMKYEINLYDLDNAYNTFSKILNKHGYETMLYSSKFYLENIWLNTKKDDVWLAHYTNKTDYNKDYIIWQLTNIGKVDGIKGNVDIDIYYKK